MGGILIPKTLYSTLSAIWPHSKEYYLSQVFYFDFNNHWWFLTGIWLQVLYLGSDYTANYLSVKKSRNIFTFLKMLLVFPNLGQCQKKVADTNGVIISIGRQYLLHRKMHPRHPCDLGKIPDNICYREEYPKIRHRLDLRENGSPTHADVRYRGEVFLELDHLDDNGQWSPLSSQITFALTRKSVNNCYSLPEDLRRR